MSQSLSRRRLLHALGLSGVGLLFTPGLLRGVQAATPPSRRTLVTVFLRGGVDGLSLVPPVEDAAYHRARPSLALKSSGDGAALSLSSPFGLHPRLEPLLPLWKEGQLAVLHGVGLPTPVRSHFDAQDFVESGTPGRKSTPDGWLNRALGSEAQAHAAPLRAVALQSTLPRALFGDAGALAMGRLEEFRLRVGNRGAQATRGFEALYAGAVDDALRTTGQGAFEALSHLDEEHLARLPPTSGVEYPRAPLGQRLADIARLIKGDVGLEVAATEMGGWDTHAAQGAATGTFANRCAELSGALSAFARDLGPRLEHVTVVVLTEFGRTVRENGSRGTDHGVGSAMLVLGGGVRGGRAYGRFEPLTADRLQDGRDVPAWTDVRAPLSEVLRACRPGVDLTRVFPGYSPGTPLGLFT
ncbi:Uncharacterized conserved protein, DUF1501 family [Myxococcus fulvus]|uniref:Uncharacterized conserved protein, DUF1501 family n=1 Tax=Myxococcus fulvus TaxID=33 RepID=A0A511T108_MYXFU|nr:DUF1501 domain-containing protein [Myxococcus fulvus]GEN07263.1 hypothetical protein MFU01_23000 [Myxococcus fulvus]SET96790.1 Uncharacterized conserved protein, DUF1501 family [Myxococcus fulvus]